MKLEEALRKIIRQFGVSVLQEKRLMFILSDFRAFNDHPAVKQVFQSIVSDGSGKKLCSLFLDDDSEGCLSFARSLKMSLAEDRHFKQELADYAVDSITFAMGLQTTVMEPADHGFDPMENGNSADHVREEERKESDSGVRAESHSPDARVQEQHPHMEKPKPAGSSSVAKVNAPGTVAQADAGSVKKSSPFRMKWLAVLVLIAGAFAFGKLSSGGSGQPEPVQVQVQPAQEITAGNAAQESAVTRNNDSAEDDVQAVMTADQQSGMYEYDQGWNYERGLGVRQDYAEALKWYRKAAELGNKEARIRIEAVETLISRDKKGFSQNSSGTGQTQSDADGEGEIEALALGNRYFNEKNYAEAVKYYRKAAELGNAYAQTTLGWMYDQAKGVRRNYAEAAKWYRKAAEQGNNVAQNNLGTLYYNGQGVKRNYSEALKWFRKAADHGIAAAYGWLGDMYYNGQGVKKNYGESAKWYRKAAEQGYAYAQNELGVLYYNGQGVKRNYGEALKWFRKAADQGNEASYGWLGSMYYEGQGVKKDYSEAAKWFRKGAERGDEGSQFYLGWMYEDGTYVGKDDAEAAKWYRKAAAQGNKEAKEKLQYLDEYLNNPESIRAYEQGYQYYISNNNYEEALKLFKKAAALGNHQAEYMLGWMFERGIAVTKDRAEALKWYRKAAAAGNADAKGRLNQLGL